jgi:hypothetical protein
MSKKHKRVEHRSCVVCATAYSEDAIKKQWRGPRLCDRTLPGDVTKPLAVR